MQPQKPQPQDQQQQSSEIAQAPLSSFEADVGRVDPETRRTGTRPPFTDWASI